MNNTTLLNLRVSNQVKDDFMTICKLNRTSMTGEIVRFINEYISTEIRRFKEYQNDSLEINQLKINNKLKQKINQSLQFETHGNLIKDPETQTWHDKETWSSRL